MKRSRNPVHAEWLILAGLVCFLAVPVFAASSAWAVSSAGQSMLAQAAPGRATPSPGTTQAPTGPQPPASPITPYVAMAYSIVGPIDVALVSTQGIVLHTGAKNLGIDFTGKNVVVLDQNSNPLTLSAVQKGTWVYVCRKGNNVVVVVLPDIGPTGGAPK